MRGRGYILPCKIYLLEFFYALKTVPAKFRTPHLLR